MSTPLNGNPRRLQSSWACQNLLYFFLFSNLTKLKFFQSKMPKKKLKWRWKWEKRECNKSLNFCTNTKNEYIFNKFDKIRDVYRPTWFGCHVRVKIRLMWRTSGIFNTSHEEAFPVTSSPSETPRATFLHSLLFCSNDLKVSIIPLLFVGSWGNWNSISSTKFVRILYSLSLRH